MAQALKRLADARVSVWLDDLSRPRIQTGSLARMVEAGDIVGITTNPTIFAKAIGAGSGYEDQLRDLALRGTAVGETLRLLTAWDVRAACDVLRPVYDRTGRRDGRVSIEVDPRISGDADRTAAETRGLWWLVESLLHNRLRERRDGVFWCALVLTGWATRDSIAALPRHGPSDGASFSHSGTTSVLPASGRHDGLAA